jgi:hypothetical protein
MRDLVILFLFTTILGLALSHDELTIEDLSDKEWHFLATDGKLEITLKYIIRDWATGDSNFHFREQKNEEFKMIQFYNDDLEKAISQKLTGEGFKEDEKERKQILNDMMREMRLITKPQKYRVIKGQEDEENLKNPFIFQNAFGETVSFKLQSGKVHVERVIDVALMQDSSELIYIINGKAYLDYLDVFPKEKERLIKFLKKNNLDGLMSTTSLLFLE